MGDNTLTTISMSLFVLGFYLFRNTGQSKASTGVFLIVAVSSMLFYVFYGIADYFSGSGIDEATIYHLEYGLGGAGFLEYSKLIGITITGLLFGSLFILWFVTKCKINRRYGMFTSFLPSSLMSASLFLNPASVDIYNRNLIFSEQITSHEVADYDYYYREPYIKQSGDNYKNIVYIYAESFERTYFNENAFPGLIKGLRELQSKSTYFTNIQQVDGAGWTIGGITASQCGIPLFTPSHRNSMWGMDSFLSSAVCLGDLLSSEGYSLDYYGGARLSFSGKGKFLKTHGFSNISGLNELLPKLENKEYKNSWGLYDDVVLDFAFDRFMGLSEAGQKFGLFTLTLDTHHPFGHPSKSCNGVKYKDGLNKILNSVACSDYLITRFVKKIMQSAYAKNTLIVVASDHLAMRNTAHDILEGENRTNLFMIRS